MMSGLAVAHGACEMIASTCCHCSIGSRTSIIAILEAPPALLRACTDRHARGARPAIRCAAATIIHGVGPAIFGHDADAVAARPARKHAERRLIDRRPGA